MKILLLSVVFGLMHKPIYVSGHARLMEPPSRSSMWRVGYPTKKNFNDNALYCGGMQVQWNRNGGKCGICGDPWHMPQPRENEAGGVYGRGIITRHYSVGQVIKATVDVTTNHKGYFEFRLCPNDNPKKEVSQQCLDKHLLQIVESSGTKYYVADKGNGKVSVHLQLPKGMSCTQCVLQWTYVAGNNWGICEDRKGRIGCGPQETFRGCSDIAIGSGKDYNGNSNGISPAKPTGNDIDDKPHESGKSASKRPARPTQSSSNSGFPFFSFHPQNTNYHGKGKLPSKPSPWNRNGVFTFSSNFGKNNTLTSGDKPGSFDDIRRNLMRHSNGRKYFISWSHFPGRNITTHKEISKGLRL